MFNQAEFPDLLSGLAEPDDAAVWRLDDKRALVVTTDFFTPIVDEAYDYGAIAAANAISDIYAMGAEPFLALNVAALPANLPLEIIQDILRGAAEKCREAGVVVAGGHTVKNDEPTFGLVVVGMADPAHILKKSGARPGDLLLLSKPLGTGVISTALKQEKASPAHVQAAVEWMKKLNRSAGRLALELNAHAATDVTGFGLLGHAWEMASASGVGMQIDFKQLPFMEGVRDYAAQGIFPGGAFDNLAYYSQHLHFAENITEIERLLCNDAQTSGGILMAVPRSEYEKMIVSTEQQVWLIGEVTGGDAIHIL